MIITVCCEKGGSGKSSISQSFAVYLKKEKRLDILLVDADPQRTTGEWCEERQENDLVHIPCVEKRGNISSDIKELSNHYDFIVVDCGGADSKEMRSSLSISDAAIIPFRPKRRDLKTAIKMSDIIETVQAINPDIKIRSLLTQCPTLPSQHKRILNAKNLLRSLDLNPLDNYTRNLNSWDDAEEDGRSVLEYGEDDKAKKDALDVFSEFLESLNNE